MFTTNNISNTQNKRKQLDDYTCGLIIGRFQSGKCPAEIVRDMKLPRSTIVDCINRFKKTGTGVSKKRTGRPKKLTARDRRTICRRFRKEPFVPFTAHNQQLKLAGINIHKQTLSKYAKDEGFRSYTPASVPMLSTVNKKKRLAWAKEKVNWTLEQWMNVIWSDESRFNV